MYGLHSGDNLHAQSEHRGDGQSLVWLPLSQLGEVGAQKCHDNVVDSFVSSTADELAHVGRGVLQPPQHSNLHLEHLFGALARLCLEGTWLHGVEEEYQFI